MEFFNRFREALIHMLGGKIELNNYEVCEDLENRSVKHYMTVKVVDPTAQEAVNVLDSAQMLKAMTEKERRFL